MNLRILIALLPLAVVGCATSGGAGTRSGFVDVDGGKLYYEAAGRGPAVVLIHGGQLDRRMWDEQFTLLAKDYQAIRYDVRGFGRSSTATRPFHSHEDLRALLDYLKVEKANLVGLSLGGRIAFDFALTYPQRVQRLIGVGPGLSGFDWSPEQGERISRVYVAALDESLEKATELWLQDPYMAPAMEHAELQPRLRQLGLENAKCYWASPYLDRPPRPLAAERLGELKVPTFMIVGERDVPDIQRLVDRVVAEVPGARKTVIPGAGHIVNMEQPVEFNRALLQILKTGE